MTAKDDQHWLHRLSTAAWLAAAAHELEQAEIALGRRAVRTVVTHARRGAGMALNAILRADAETETARPEARWGRSYMEHLVALAHDPTAPTVAREAAALLRDTPPQAPALIQLGSPDRRPIEAARRILEWARVRTTTSAGTDR
jgi:hypothetical protein